MAFGHCRSEGACSLSVDEHIGTLARVHFLDTPLSFNSFSHVMFFPGVEGFFFLCMVRQISGSSLPAWL